MPRDQVYFFIDGRSQEIYDPSRGTFLMSLGRLNRVGKPYPRSATTILGHAFFEFLASIYYSDLELDQADVDRKQL